MTSDASAHRGGSRGAVEDRPKTIRDGEVIDCQGKLGAEATDAGLVRPHGEGETTSLFGDTYVVKAASEETGGALGVIEAALVPTAVGRHYTSTGC